jgi:tight adherence protein C
MLLIAIFIIFIAISLGVLGLLWKEENAMEQRIAGLRGDSSGPIDFRTPRNESLTARLIVPLGDSVAGMLSSFLPQRIIGSIERQLIQAGQPITLAGFLGAAFLLEALVLAMGVMLILPTASEGGIQLLALPALAVLGFLMPRIWLGNRVRHRQKEILKSLPDAFDLITTCVEAGLGLDAALAKVAEKVEGPFAEELLISLKEISLGKMRRDALKELGERTGVPDLVSFINAVVQAETMGTSIASVLRVQAEQMRTRRRQRAEQQAYQAPVKMIFPLVLCIFPTLFIVILGPAAISIYQSFVGG